LGSTGTPYIEQRDLFGTPLGITLSAERFCWSVSFFAEELKDLKDCKPEF
jgi:hypothetical protein